LLADVVEFGGGRENVECVYWIVMYWLWSFIKTLIHLKKKRECIWVLLKLSKSDFWVSLSMKNLQPLNVITGVEYSTLVDFCVWELLFI